MTHQTASAQDTTHGKSSAMFAIIGGGLLTLIWGAYTVLIVVEIAMMGAP